MQVLFVELALARFLLYLLSAWPEGDMPEPTLEFVAAQIARLLDEMRDLKEQMVVLTGMMLRIDNSLTAALAQGRLNERHIARTETRLESLEARVAQLEARPSSDAPPPG